MRNLPPEPHVGDRITADLLRELIRCIRERQILKGPNYALSSGPNGTFLRIDFPKPDKTDFDRGCWNIKIGTRTEDGESSNVRVFGNQFYIDGENNLTELDLEDAVEDFVCQGELEDDEEYTAGDRPFVCLKVPATTNTEGLPMLVGYADIDELKAEQKDVAYVVRPLYKFNHDGSIAIDLRNCPLLQVAEVLP